MDHSSASPSSDSAAAHATLLSRLGALGPGLMMAGAAIGVSHLVQSTRAGALYGFDLLWIVLLINLLKYPFFEFGHRYCQATGENLIEGYRRLGKPFLWLFFVLNLLAAVISLAGVTLVTAGLAEVVFGLGLNAFGWSLIILALCSTLILVGHYASVDFAVKLIIGALAVATLTALLLAVGHGSGAPADFQSPSAWRLTEVGFLIALMGWMPAPIEVSVFQSVWIEAKQRSLKRKLTRREGVLDFNIGYLGTTLLALAFLLLGGLLMHGSTAIVVASSVAFAGQLIDLYRSTLGGWSVPVIAVAALATMLSTTLTVADGYPRGMAETWRRLFPQGNAPTNAQAPFRLFLIAVLGTVAVALLIIGRFGANMPTMIDAITTISFLTAPVFAYLNLKLIRSAWLPAEWKPGWLLMGIAWSGLFFFGAFSLFFLAYRVFMA